MWFLQEKENELKEKEKALLWEIQLAEEQKDGAKTKKLVKELEQIHQQWEPIGDAFRCTACGEYIITRYGYVTPGKCPNCRAVKEKIKVPENVYEGGSEMIESLADGMLTGMYDMKGTPIRIGDMLVYYKRQSRHLSDDEDIEEFPKAYIAGTGQRRYVYTGKVRRRYVRVKFEFPFGIYTEPNLAWHSLARDERGWLKTVLVVNGRDDAPVLSVDDLA